MQLMTPPKVFLVQPWRRCWRHPLAGSQKQEGEAFNLCLPRKVQSRPQPAPPPPPLLALLQQQGGQNRTATGFQSQGLLSRWDLRQGQRTQGSGGKLQQWQQGINHLPTPERGRTSLQPNAVPTILPFSFKEKEGGVQSCVTHFEGPGCSRFTGSPSSVSLPAAVEKGDSGAMFLQFPRSVRVTKHCTTSGRCFKGEPESNAGISASR